MPMLIYTYMHKKCNSCKLILLTTEGHEY